MRSNRQTHGRILALAALALLPGIALTGCEKKPAAGGPGAAGGAPQGPMPVETVTAQQADVAVGGEWVGTIDGFVNAQIQPQVSGYLIRQNYREGAQVTKGQVLFDIDPRPFQAALEQAEGQRGQALGAVGQANGAVGQAQAQLGLAQINVKRDTPLAEQHAIATSQLDTDKQTEATQEANVKTAQAQVAAAQAQVAAAQAQIDTAKLNLGFTHVRSLISGVAGQATVQVGNLVSPQSVLTAVSQLDPVKVYFSLSDAEYLRLTGGGTGDLLHNKNAPNLTLKLSDGSTYGHQGHIVFVDRQMNQQTGAIRIAAAFANPGNVLRPGQFGRVTATTETLRNAILVPQLAVTELQGIQQVHTVVNGKAHVANVELGPQSGNNWVIKSGLEPGATVIIDQLQKLQEGMPVSPHAAPPQSTGQSTGQPTAKPAAGR